MKNKSDGSVNKDIIGRRKAIVAASSLTAFAIPSIGSAMVPEGKEKKIKSPSTIYTQELYTLREGVSRQFNTFDLDTKEKAIPIRPGEKVTILNHEDPGIITRMWFTFSGWFWEHWDPRKEKLPDPTILKKLILRIYWDGNDYPSVEAPMGDFFGIGHCEYKHYLSKYLGMSSGGFYSYFPMPFQKVRIEIENFHDRVEPHVFLNANYTALDTLPEGVGRFHCLYNAGTNPGQEPLTILKANGYGHFVGCCLSMQGEFNNNLRYLEAPEYFYIDTKDKSKPTFTGTGLEDYFNGGWYFRDGEFTGPLHGVPLKDSLRSMISMYRFHENDAICFKKNIEMAFINPKSDAREFKFSSTAYWYQDQATRLLFKLPKNDKLVDWYRMRDTDHQSIP